MELLYIEVVSGKKGKIHCLSGMQEVLYSNHVFAVGRLVNYNIILPYFYKALKTW